jgi:hypothetical protein
VTYQATDDAPVLDRRWLVRSYFLGLAAIPSLLCRYPPKAACVGAFGSNAYTHTILSSAPDAKYLPFEEKRTAWMVPEWWLTAASCLGFVYSGFAEFRMASVDQIRTYPSV